MRTLNGGDGRSDAGAGADGRRPGRSASRLRRGRRSSAACAPGAGGRALNEALHELRRPLQALALAPPAGGAGGRAVARLGADGGGRAGAARARDQRRDAARRSGRRCRPRPLLEAAVGRWRARAALAGGSLAPALAGRRGDASSGDRCELAQALDNLIVNAIEHGGPADRGRGRRRARPAADRGRRLGPRVAPAARRGARPSRSPACSAAAAAATACAVVRRIAAAHGGSFALRALGAAAPRRVLELPLPARGRRRMSRRGRALAFLLAALLAAGGRGGDRRRLRQPASPAATASCGRSWSPSTPTCGPGRAIGPRRGRRPSSCGGCRRGSCRRGRWPPRPRRSGSCRRRTVPAGSYLLASQLRPPRRERAGALGLGGGRRPVEIAVSGAEALLGRRRRSRSASGSTSS